MDSADSLAFSSIRSATRLPFTSAWSLSRRSSSAGRPSTTRSRDSGNRFAISTIPSAVFCRGNSPQSVLLRNVASYSNATGAYHAKDQMEVFQIPVAPGFVEFLLNIKQPLNCVNKPTHAQRRSARSRQPLSRSTLPRCQSRLPEDRFVLRTAEPDKSSASRRCEKHYSSSPSSLVCCFLTNMYSNSRSSR